LFSFFQPYSIPSDDRSSWGLSNEEPNTLECREVEIPFQEPLAEGTTKGEIERGGYKRKMKEKMPHLLLALISLAVLAGLIWWIMKSTRTTSAKNQQKKKLQQAHKASLAANKSAQSALQHKQTQLETGNFSNANANANANRNNIPALLAATQHPPLVKSGEPQFITLNSSKVPNIRASGIIQAKPNPSQKAFMGSPSMGLAPLTEGGIIHGGYGRSICIGCKAEPCTRSNSCVINASENNQLHYYPRDPFSFS